MKKIFACILLMIAIVSCYDEYLEDFDYSSAYFPYQMNVRTFVVGEGMKIQIGADIGGVRENTRDRNISFAVDNSFITPEILTLMKIGPTYIKTSVSGVAALLPLPPTYYTLSDYGRIVIKSGQHMGSVVLKPDSALFLSDPATIRATYAISLKITDAPEVDTILKSKEYAVIGLKYENMLFGNYWHGGATIVKNPGGVPIDTIYYKTTIPTIETKIWKLITTGPNSLVANGYSDQVTTKNEMTLTLNGSNITVSSAAGSTFPVMADGACTFNRAKKLQDRKIFLTYKYVNALGNTCYATDTLTFRNRFRDGVNEWQDDNPSNY